MVDENGRKNEQKQNVNVVGRGMGNDWSGKHQVVASCAK